MQRTIKSFVLRKGRISTRQQNALEHHFKDYELKFDNKEWDLEVLFARKADTIVEIGFGMGASLAAMAEASPELNFIGIEVHQAGVGSLSADLHDKNLTNVRIVSHDAVEVFKHCIPKNALAGIQIFFPDPWHKKKHHKRRLIQSEFVALLSEALKQDGFLHCATDWEDYAFHMVEVLSKEPSLKNKFDGFSPRPETRPLTKFELRGQRLGHGVWDLIYLKR